MQPGWTSNAAPYGGAMPSGRRLPRGPRASSSHCASPAVAREAPRRPPRRRRSRGITLLEMTIALILASGTIIAAFPSVESFLAARREARAVNIATFDLESCVEDFLSVPFKDVLRIYTNTNPNLNPLTRFTDLHLEGETMTATLVDQSGNPVTGIVPPEPLHAIFDVTWTNVQGNTRRLTMAIARTR